MPSLRPHIALRATMLLALLGCASSAPAPAPAAQPTAAADSAEALAVFRENIAAIHARSRARYLATYLQTSGLTRTGLRGNEKGWEGWEARTREGGWPDTLIARELQVTSVAPGVVYGTYRYIGVNGGVAATGISMRVFVRTPQGMRIAITGSWPDTLPVPAGR